LQLRFVEWREKEKGRLPKKRKRKRKRAKEEVVMKRFMRWWLLQYEPKP